MKKIFTLLSIVALSSVTFAQQFNTTSSNTDKVKLLKAPGVIYSQEVLGSQGIVADVLANGNFVASADDFKLTEDSKITKINVIGFQNQGNLITTISQGVMMYIYEDENGQPAGIPGNNAVTPIAKIDIPKTHEAYNLTNPSSGSFQYSIDVTKAVGDLVLSKDKVYWLVFAAKTNLTAYTAPTRFNWYGGEVVGNYAKLVDPSNAFGAGATNWTDIYELVGTSDLDGLAFSIEGESSLGIGEIYSNTKKINVYPNPATTEVNIKLDGTKVADVTVADVTGRVIPVKFSKDGKVDTSKLSSGVYFLRVKDDKGVTRIQKIIKK